VAALRGVDGVNGEPARDGRGFGEDVGVGDWHGLRIVLPAVISKGSPTPKKIASGIARFTRTGDGCGRHPISSFRALPLSQTAFESRRFVAPSRRALAQNLILGAFAGFLFRELGFLDAAGFLDPTLVIVCCALAGAAVSFVRVGTWLTALDVLLLAVYLMIAVTPMVGGTARSWVRSDPPLAQPAAAVVVLSGGLTADSSLGAAGTERLAGLELVRAGAAPRLVTSRVTSRFGRRIVSSDAGQRRLVALAGLDTAAWSRVDSVHSTRDEALHVARLLQPAAGRSIVVVTSAMHTRRACATFEGVGFRVRCVAARGLENTTRSPASDSDRLEAFRELLYERIGMLKYRWKGWVR
jgi:uncharacterized SAM-binding protein YcdF (DUF218 family)